MATTNNASGGDSAVQQPPNPLIYLDEGAISVQDADEEIFDLYANLAAHARETSTQTGLGFASSTDAMYHIDFELHRAAPVGCLVREGEVIDKAPSHVKRRGKSKKTASRNEEKAERIVSVEIAQDLESLRNRKGDTGSVIWRSSLFFAKQILQRHYFPLPSSTSFIRFELASSAKVLELGAGTGVLGILLHQLFGSWTASDQYDNLKLIARNIKGNGDPKNLHIEEVDWMDIHAEWIKAKRELSNASKAGIKEEYDLVIAVDCIYNEALIPPFISTLEYYTTRGKTVAVVVCELRSADVMTTFLEEWIGRGGWTIYRLSENALGDELKYSFVTWVAWRT